MIKFIFPIPPSINATYRSGNGKFWKSTKARDWENEVGWIIKQKKIKTINKEALYVEVSFYFKRDRDIDNSLKILLDALQKFEVIENDIQIQTIKASKYKDKDNARVEISITPLLCI